MASFKRRAKRFAKKAGRVGLQAFSIAAPVGGALIGGPVGAAIGTGVAAGGSQVFAHKRALKRKALKTSLIAGGASFAGAGLLSIAGGGGLTTGAVANLGNIFGGGGSIPAAVNPELPIGPSVGSSTGAVTGFSPELTGAGTDSTSPQSGLSIPPPTELLRRVLRSDRTAEILDLYGRKSAAQDQLNDPTAGKNLRGGSGGGRSGSPFAGAEGTSEGGGEGIMSALTGGPGGLSLKSPIVWIGGAALAIALVRK